MNRCLLRRGHGPVSDACASFIAICTVCVGCASRRGELTRPAPAPVSTKAAPTAPHAQTNAFYSPKSPPVHSRGLLTVDGMEGPGNIVVWNEPSTQFLGYPDGIVMAFDEMGKPLWSTAVRGAVRDLILMLDGPLVVLTSDGLVAGIDKHSGRILWQRRFDGGEIAGASWQTGVWHRGARPPNLYDGTLWLTFSGRNVIVMLSEEWLTLGPDGQTLCNIQKPPYAFSKLVGDYVARKRRGPLGDTCDGQTLSNSGAQTMRFFGMKLALAEPVHSIVVLNSDSAFALRASSFDYTPMRVPASGWIVRGDKAAALPALDPPLRKETFAAHMPGEAEWSGSGYLHHEIAWQHPNGRLQILAGRTHRMRFDYDNFLPAAGVVFEQTPGGWTEVRSLHPLFKRLSYDAQKPDNPTVARKNNRVLICTGSFLSTSRSGCIYVDNNNAKVLPHPPIHVNAVEIVGDDPWVVGSSSLSEDGPGQIARWTGSDWSIVASPESPVPFGAIAAASPEDVWVSPRDPANADLWFRALYRLQHGTWTSYMPPIREVASLWVDRDGKAWAAGADGLAHFDGTSWSRVGDIPGQCHQVAGWNTGQVWAACNSGLWRGGNVSALTQKQSPVVPPGTMNRTDNPSALHVATVSTDRMYVEPVRLRYQDHELRGALTGATAQDDTLWIHDGTDVFQIVGTSVTKMATGVRAIAAKNAKGFADVLHADLLRGARNLAPVRAGNGWFITERGLFQTDGKSVRHAPHQLDGAVALAASDPNHGGLFVVGAGFGSVPKLLVKDATGWTMDLRVPDAAYADIARARNGTLWLAGALTSRHDSSRYWPAGEGIMIQAPATGPIREYRSSTGPLLAIASTGEDEAWAVGIEGHMVRVQGGKASAYLLPTKAPLRALVATHPDDVWIVGDRRSLYHWNGKTMEAVDVSKYLGPMDALTGLVQHEGQIWVMGPQLIGRIVVKR